MRYAVVDVETTGFNPREDRVVEMACVVLHERRIVRTWNTLVNPERPIPEYATRVHGLTDEHVAHAPSFEIAQRLLRRLCAGATVVAHNANFDIGFLPAIAHLPSLCTLRLARHCFPEAPNHKNQTLREYLHIDDDLRRVYNVDALPAHRALADALVTAGILLRCLERYTTAATA
jgi:DNA polymerase III epsilon subunit family exonuclease